MKVAAVSLVLILSLGASAFPLQQWDLAPQANKAIQMSLDQVNAQYGRDRLFRLTKGSVKRVVPLGMNTHDLMMNFAVRETDCLKTSGADPLNCNFRRGFFVAEASCYSRVRVTGESSQLITLRCSQADSSSSSSESSEEMMRGRTWVYNPFAPREPVNPPVDVRTAAPSRRETIERENDMFRERAPARGDNFSNFLSR